MISSTNNNLVNNNLISGDKKELDLFMMEISVDLGIKRIRRMFIIKRIFNL